MITAKTVFILGAGASNCYNFPTGAQLKKLIIDKCNRSEYIHHFENRLKLHQGITHEFAQSFQFSRCNTIDQFIAIKNNPDYSSIAKYLIIDIFNDAEKTRFLFLPESTINDKLEHIDKIEPVYDVIWNYLLYSNGSLNKTADAVVENKVSFISFNYDRSLEFYLYTAFKNTFELSDNDTDRYLQKFPIHHVYGSMIKDKNALSKSFKVHPYQSTKSSDDLNKLSENCEFSFISNSEQTLKEIKSELDSAKVIIILGFGFDDFNIDKIGLFNLYNKSYFASGRGISENRRAYLSRKLYHDPKANAFYSDSISDTIHAAFLK